MTLKIKKRLDKLSTFKLIITSYMFLMLFIFIPFKIIEIYFNLELKGSNVNMKILEKIVFIVFFTPLLETLIFQIAIIFLSLKIFPKLPSVAIIISALFFSLSHFYSFYYIVFTFFIGLFFAILFFISKRKKINPFLVIYSVHLLYNLSLFLFYDFLNLSLF